MSLETERKYLDVDFDHLRSALAGAGAEDLGAHFESNVVYDTPELSLCRANKLLRVRSQEWPGRIRHVLTLKLPVPEPAEGGFKAREERELEVGSAAVMGSVLRGLGFVVAARYEKVRSVWRLAGARGGGPMLVELDELPFARVVELEGGVDALDTVAERLGLDKHEISTKSYHALHQEWRSAQGLPPDRSFVFGPEPRRALRQRLGLSDEAAACF